MQYQPKYPCFWDNRKLQRLTPEARFIYDFLASNRQVSASGIYHLNPGVLMEAERGTGLPEVMIWAGIFEICLESHDARPLAWYDPETEIIWITGKYKRSPVKSPNHMVSIGNEFYLNSWWPFWWHFFKKYPAVKNYLMKAKTYKNQSEIKPLLQGLKKGISLIDLSRILTCKKEEFYKSNGINGNPSPWGKPCSNVRKGKVREPFLSLLSSLPASEESPAPLPPDPGNSPPVVSDPSSTAPDPETDYESVLAQDPPAQKEGGTKFSALLMKRINKEITQEELEAELAKIRKGESIVQKGETETGESNSPAKPPAH